MSYIQSIIYHCIIAFVLVIPSKSLTQVNIQVHNDDSRLSTVSAKIDSELFLVLSRFNIDVKQGKKKVFTIPETNLNRIERSVNIPKNVDPLHINQALNILAKKYNGTAIGSENTKGKTVTIHIRLDGYIIETIILRNSIELNKVKRKK